MEEVRDEKSDEIEVEGDASQPSEEWMDILGSGDLKKRVIREGIVETRPTRGDTVCVNLSGYLEDGTMVEEHKELMFTLGDSEVIEGLDLALPLMDKGEISDVFIASRFAYGTLGLPPDIPPDAGLTYNIELVDYKPEVEPGDLPIAERKEIGIRKRERGNWWFNRTEYAQAIKCYTAAVDFLDDVQDSYEDSVSDEVKDILEERLKALNNMAAAQIKVEAYDMANKSLDKVLICQPNNIKALFRKGKVLSHQGDSKEAVTYMKKALALDPESKPVQQELARITEKAKKESECEKSLYKRMLGIKNDSIQEKETDTRSLKPFPYRLWALSFLGLIVVMIAYNNLGRLRKYFD